jgi:hypothetical protein
LRDEMVERPVGLRSAVARMPREARRCLCSGQRVQSGPAHAWIKGGGIVEQ